MKLIEFYKWYKLKKEIIEWNIKTFPDNQYGSQLLKVGSELGELNQAFCREDIENIKEEASDVFISVVGLFRFKRENKTFKSDYKKLLKQLQRLSKQEKFDLYECVKSKMEINKIRIFEKTENNTHQHVEKRTLH